MPFQPGPSPVIINNPFNVPIALDMEFFFPCQIRAEGANGVEFNVQTFINGSPSVVLNAATRGPGAPVSNFDPFEMYRRIFFGVPALGSITVTFQYQVQTVSGLPVLPNTELRFARFLVNWYGVNLELV
jgi:hypothetical protein